MVINLVSGIYYNLTGTAAEAWPMLAAGVPLDAIAAALSQACSADAAVERCRQSPQRNRMGAARCHCAIAPVR
jgi:hypothetical protein